MNATRAVVGALGTSSTRTIFKNNATNLSHQRNFTELPFGKRQVEQLKNWMPTLAVFGVTSFVGMCYFTDWRVTNEWIPFYSGKFKKDE